MFVASQILRNRFCARMHSEGGIIHLGDFCPQIWFRNIGFTVFQRAVHAWRSAKSGNARRRAHVILIGDSVTDGPTPTPSTWTATITVSSSRPDLSRIFPAHKAVGFEHLVQRLFKHRQLYGLDLPFVERYKLGATTVPFTRLRS